MCSLCGALGTRPVLGAAGRSGDNARWQLRREAMETAAAMSDLLGRVASRSRQIRITASSSRSPPAAPRSCRASAKSGICCCAAESRFPIRWRDYEHCSTIPVHILTGFLGSGKTTLLNQALTSSSGFGADTAIVVNEFGDVALDQMFIQERSEETLVLKSGCICCSIRTDLVSTLMQLAAMSDARATPLKRVVIETSGISDPAPILTTLGSDFRSADAFPSGRDRLRRRCDRPWERTRRSVAQLAAADACIITKLILPSGNRMVSAEQRVHRLNPGAAIIPANRFRMDRSSQAMRRTGTLQTFWRASSRSSPHSRRGIRSAASFCVRQARRHGRSLRSG